MTKTMIIKVARAIYAANVDKGDCDYSRLAPIMKAMYERMAKAAIVATDVDRIRSALKVSQE